MPELTAIICYNDLTAIGAVRAVRIMGRQVPDDVSILGYDDIACFGAKGIATPNLDRMAKAGMRFTDFYAPASVCTLARRFL